MAVVSPGDLAAPLPKAGVADKGLRKGAISFISSVVIGVASTAPGYSLAATLGLIVTAVGFQSPAVLWVAFIPMLCIASAYLYMNRTDPDCGTTFAWVSQGDGPVGGLARRLGDHRRRRRRDGEPRADRGPVLVHAVRLGLGGSLDVRGHGSSASCGSSS